jgi:hypothetical protein
MDDSLWDSGLRLAAHHLVHCSILSQLLKVLTVQLESNYPILLLGSRDEPTIYMMIRYVF